LNYDSLLTGVPKHVKMAVKIPWDPWLVVGGSFGKEALDE
jgi:hypothetical protein